MQAIYRKISGEATLDNILETFGFRRLPATAATAAVGPRSPGDAAVQGKKVHLSAGSAGMGGGGIGTAEIIKPPRLFPVLSGRTNPEWLD